MFEKILVPLDGSDHSLRALETAIQIAMKFRASVTLIHVYSVSVAPVIMPESTTLTPSGVPVMTPTEVTRLIDAARDLGNRILKDAEMQVRSKNIRVNTIIKEGNTVQEITKVANEDNFDLIVMGVRGISKLRELLVGSVSEGVIKHSSCPVLVVK